MNQHQAIETPDKDVSPTAETEDNDLQRNSRSTAD